MVQGAGLVPEPSGCLQPLAGDPTGRAVESPGQAIEELVDLVLRNDERRADGDAISEQRAQDQSFGLRESHDLGGHALFGIELRLAALVGTISSPAIRPIPRASPTSGWSRSPATRRRKRGSLAETLSKMRSRL